MLGLMRETLLGGLRVRIAGGTDRAGRGSGPVLVLLHGFGAPGDDLASLWRVLRVPPGTRFVFPEAPLSLGPAYGNGRAWWMVDIARMQDAVMRGAARDLSDEVPKGLAEARAKLVALLDAVDAELGPSHRVIGGFSQGAMLACDVALRTDRPLDGLVLMSGTLIAAREWGPLMANRRGLAVLQSHGQDDVMLPYFIAERLRDELRGAGLDVTWIPFRGGHGIPPEVLDGLGRFVTALTSE
jgi:phospholipase/carboxylesterase